MRWTGDDVYCMARREPPRKYINSRTLRGDTAKIVRHGFLGIVFAYVFREV
jgi:hypothetical protein